jgi:type II secretory pathway predicted ATPase ExeA
MLSSTFLEEAQNFSATALEEVRLLTCARTDTRPPFSLLLIGEDSLLPRLQMCQRSFGIDPLSVVLN